jgi:tetratricopeptide (TPR) repeat protein
MPDDQDRPPPPSESSPSETEETQVLHPAAGGGGAGESLTPGEILAERFEVVRFLGRGGMGEVFEARDRELDQRVALKVLRPEIALDPPMLARFRREIQLSRQVTHPNVCRIFDLFRHRDPDSGEELLFLTMELLVGETLEERIRRRGRLPPGELLPLARQMAAALQAAHRLGIVHRDFKPANVLLVSEPEGWRAVVTDFGLARSIAAPAAEGTAAQGAEQVTGQQTILGTLSYMAPEQLTRGPVTPATDVYAFGMVLYQALTGRIPFADDEDPLGGAIHRLREDPPPPRALVPELDGAWDRLVMECLARDPGDRPADGAELHAALDQLGPGPGPATAATDALRADPSVAEPVAAVSAVSAATVDAGEPQPPRRRWRWPSLVGAAALLAVVATAVWWTGRPRAPSPPAAEGPPSVRRSAAVLDLRNLLGRPEADWLSSALPEMLTTELAAGSRLRLVPRDNVVRMMRELDLEATEGLDPETRGRIRRYLGADLVIQGSFAALGDQADDRLRLDLRVADLRADGTVAYVAAVGNERELFELVAEAGGRLRDELGAGELEPAEREALRAARPASFEAARLYAEGLAALRRYDAPSARRLLEGAVAADPELAVAHVALAEAWNQLGYESRAREAAERARDALPELSREESLLVEGSLAEVSHDWPRAIEAFRTLWGFFPDNLEYGLRLAELRTRSGRGEEALATVAEMHRLPSPLGEDPRIDLAEARAAGLLSDLEHQLDAAGRAAEKARRRGARQLLAAAEMERAAALRQQGRWPEALLAIEGAARIYRQAGYRRGVAEARNVEGIVQWSRGELEAARESFERASEIYREIGDRGKLMRSQNNAAMALASAGDAAGARELFERSLAEAQEVGDPQAVSAILNNLAILARNQGRLEEARRGFEEALEIKRRIGEKATVVLALGSLGLLAVDAADLETAGERLEESLAIAREIGDRLAVARYLTSLGRVAEERGELDRALDLHDQALAIAVELGSRPTEAEARRGRGQLLRRRWQLEAARSSLEESLAIAREIGEPVEVAAAEVALGWLALDGGDAGKALELGRRAVEVQRGQSLVSEAEALELLALAELAGGRPAAAAEELDRARRMIGGTDFLLARLRLTVRGAPVRAAAGTDRAEIRRELEGVLRHSRDRGLVALGFEAELALAEQLAAVDPEAGKRRLADLAERAAEAGFRRIAALAGEASRK